MKTFLLAFVGSTLGLFVVIVALSYPLRPYLMLNALAAHKVVDGPWEAKRLLLDLDPKTTTEEADKIVMEIYRDYRRVYKPIPDTRN